MANDAASVVLHIDCGLDSRVKRVSAENTNWYDIDFADVIAERKKYYDESEFYHMLSADMRESGWKSQSLLMDCYSERAAFPAHDRFISADKFMY